MTRVNYQVIIDPTIIEKRIKHKCSLYSIDQLKRIDLREVYTVNERLDHTKYGPIVRLDKVLPSLFTGEPTYSYWFLQEDIWPHSSFIND